MNHSCLKLKSPGKSRSTGLAGALSVPALAVPVLALLAAVAAPVAVGTVATAASSLLTAGTAQAAAKIRFKSLSVAHRTRGRPAVTVKRVNGVWKISNATVRFDLKATLKSKKSRIMTISMDIGGRRTSLHRGNLRWTYHIVPLRFNRAGGLLGSHAQGSVRACANLMKNRTGTRVFNHSIKITFFIGDKKGRKTGRAGWVSAKLKCVKGGARRR